ncbi:MAG: CARDB domain-containing protein [bacterium]
MKKLSIMGVLVSIFVAVTFSLCYAEGRVRGIGVYFTPERAPVGDNIRISIKFAVTGEPIVNNMGVVVRQTSPRYVGPPPPVIIVSGPFNPGEHIVDVYRYTVPTSPPARICFDIEIPGGKFRDVCLKRGRGREGWWMTVEGRGRWVETVPTPRPAPVPSAEKPDLRIVGDLVDKVLTIQNIGRAPTPARVDIEVVRECFVEGRWVPSPEWLSMGLGKRTLLAGESTKLRLGTLLGQCPSGSTKVRVVVDPRNQIAEMDENNNVVEASSLADLRIIAFTCDLNNHSYALQCMISNTGVGDAGPFGWEISVFRDGGWRSFEGGRIARLNARRRTSIFRSSLQMRSAVQVGDRLRLRIDPLNEVPETNESAEDNSRETIVVRR